MKKAIISGLAGILATGQIGCSYLKPNLNTQDYLKNNYNCVAEVNMPKIGETIQMWITRGNIRARSAYLEQCIGIDEKTYNKSVKKYKNGKKNITETKTFNSANLIGVRVMHDEDKETFYAVGMFDLKESKNE